MAMTIAVIAGVFGVGLAASQLFRLKSWLNRPQSDVDPPADPPDE